MMRKVLITGSTGVIGSAIARAVARGDARVALHYNSAAEKVQALKSDIKKPGANAFVLQADLSRMGEPERLVVEAAREMGGLGLVVHCAAVFEKTPFGEVTCEQWDRALDLGVKAAFFLAQAAALAMQRDGGRMIFLSDVAAVKPYAGYLPYCIAKAGVDALVRGLARSLAPKIQVNAVAPYIVTRPTGMSDKGWNDLLSKSPMRRAQTPEEIASVVLWLADSGESITGQVIAVDGGRLLR